MQFSRNDSFNSQIYPGEFEPIQKKILTFNSQNQN